TEEALYVVSGRAKVRTPDGLTEIGPGDFVAFPAGGPAHQLVNDGTEPLVYLAMSAIQGFDLVEYPDSDKVACSVGAWPQAKRFVFRRKDQADYFEGEG
ncbi:MAG TPA: cupin domain-containing protein, partial [Anaeromyxobacteraceae bacterium]|nr:cupin domain-containing protein [Anaeromyxobacteraceae bacterium]